MISLRNTFYYVIGVVPLQTVLALTLALIVNQRFLKGRTFFRTAFYFPSVVSLGRDLAGLPLPVHRHRRGQPVPVALRHRRARRGSPTRAA